MHHTPGDTGDIVSGLNEFIARVIYRRGCDITRVTPKWYAKGGRGVIQRIYHRSGIHTAKGQKGETQRNYHRGGDPTYILHTPYIHRTS